MARLSLWHWGRLAVPFRCIFRRIRVAEVTAPISLQVGVRVLSRTGLADTMEVAFCLENTLFMCDLVFSGAAIYHYNTFHNWKVEPWRNRKKVKNCSFRKAAPPLTPPYPSLPRSGQPLVGNLEAVIVFVDVDKDICPGNNTTKCKKYKSNCKGIR